LVDIEQVRRLAVLGGENCQHIDGESSRAVVREQNIEKRRTKVK
jgi:hypothetical protein